MAHFTRAQPFGTWINGYVPTPTDLQSFDSRQRQAVDGDNGGAWAPSSPINIAGFGLSLTGPLVIAYGGALTSGAGSPFGCYDGDVPLLGDGHAGATLTKIASFAAAVGEPGHLWGVRKQDFGLQAFFAAAVYGGSSTPAPCRALLPIRPVDGSVLTKAVVTFRVVTPHDFPPQTMPKVRVWRSDHDGNFEALTSSAAGGDPADGFVSIPSPASGPAWYSNGAPQTLTIECDQNNVVDISQYSYFVEVVDEYKSADNAWPFATFAQIAFAGVTAAIWEPSMAVTAGSVVVPTDPNQTGLYYQCTTNGTTGTVEPIWPRIALDPSKEYTDAELQVADGSTTWALSFPGTDASAMFPQPHGVITNATTGGYFVRGFGTVWHSVALTYDGISDTRPK